MKRRTFGLSLLLVAGCAMWSFHLYWKVRDLVVSPLNVIELQAADDKVLLAVEKRTLQMLFLWHTRINRDANMQTELMRVDGEEPNAFAGVVNNRQAVVLNLGMMKLIGLADDECAALFGHEVAHSTRGHVYSGRARSSTIHALGSLVGAALGMAGVPACGLISGLGADIIENSFSRDDERDGRCSGH